MRTCILFQLALSLRIGAVRIGGVAAALLIATPALAQVPGSSVTIDTIANYGGDQGSNVAGPGGTGFFDDSSVANGQAGAVGDLKAYTKAGGVDGTDDLDARSDVTQVSQWTPLGGTPGNPIDIDVTLSIDGHLRLADFASSPTGNLLTTASFTVDVITAALTTSVYNGLASFTTEKTGFTSTLVLSAFGDWQVSDFTCVASSGGETCSIDINMTLQDVAFVMPGESFAIDSNLLTETVMNGARETFGESDFFNTGSFSLSSDAPGVSFVFVPEPATGSLLAAAMLVMTGFGRSSTRRG